MEFQFCPTESYGKGCQFTPDGVICNGSRFQQQPDTGAIGHNTDETGFPNRGFPDPSNIGQDQVPNQDNPQGAWLGQPPNQQAGWPPQQQGNPGVWREQPKQQTGWPPQQQGNPGVWREQPKQQTGWPPQQQGNPGVWREQPKQQTGWQPQQQGNPGVWREQPAGHQTGWQPRL
jgi:hypothetical protein